MRWFVHYFRSLFCNHEWHVEELYNTTYDEWGDVYKKGYKVYMRCKKCGYHQRHWKN